MEVTRILVQIKPYEHFKNKDRRRNLKNLIYHSRLWRRRGTVWK